ncbi:hypothetical protein QRX60_17495 [Amycolatopsis mongoliensis]|uniref:DUF3558 domain-containing protein n=1 Tax=Amycolatopsis mongoliensis TaxID=715475 RepID=A0A9Y2NH81_9PSEU|nr:hypothetical protein [Amycolatopsis sp. 4-36]WIY05551.1 hypothetical protein QRX60_17495 [Amycolatopsis sp. 4-36]
MSTERKNESALRALCRRGKVIAVSIGATTLLVAASWLFLLPAGAAPVSACSLLSADYLAGSLGAPSFKGIAATSSQAGSVHHRCLYSGERGDRIVVVLEVADFTPSDATPGTVLADVTRSSGHRQPVTGLGDSAEFVTDLDGTANVALATAERRESGVRVHAVVVSRDYNPTEEKLKEIIEPVLSSSDSKG